MIIGVVYSLVGEGINSSQYKVPFTLGWKREMVVRRASARKNATSSDVYYHSPDGRKLRSKREITRWMEQHPEYEMPMRHFTFQRRLTDLNDPNYEILRLAKEYKPRAKK